LFTVSFGASNKCYYTNSSRIIRVAVLLFTLHNSKNIAYHMWEVLIFYADKLMMMDNSKNSRVFNLAILLKSR